MAKPLPLANCPGFKIEISENGNVPALKMLAAEARFQCDTTPKVWASDEFKALLLVALAEAAPFWVQDPCFAQYVWGIKASELATMLGGTIVGKAKGAAAPKRAQRFDAEWHDSDANIGCTTRFRR